MNYVTEVEAVGQENDNGNDQTKKLLFGSLGDTISQQIGLAEKDGRHQKWFVLSHSLFRLFSRVNQLFSYVTSRPSIFFLFFLLHNITLYYIMEEAGHKHLSNS